MIKKPPTIAHKDRRTAGRWPSKLKVRCRLKRCTEEGAWVANVRDISVEGIGLTVNRAFKPGMSLTLELPTNTNQVSKQILVEVRHARQITHMNGNGHLNGDGTGGKIWWA